MQGLDTHGAGLAQMSLLAVDKRQVGQTSGLQHNVANLLGQLARRLHVCFRFIQITALPVPNMYARQHKLSQIDLAQFARFPWCKSLSCHFYDFRDR